MLWYIAWLWLSFERPSKHPTISGRELLYIQQAIGTTTQGALPTVATTPWHAFFTSMPVYAIIVANFCRSWNFYLLVLFQASYLQHNFHLQIEEVNLPESINRYILAERQITKAKTPVPFPSGIKAFTW